MNQIDDLANSPFSTVNNSPDSLATHSSEIFQNIQDSNEISNKQNPDFDFVMDIPVNLTVELGKTRIAINDLLKLSPGSVLELDGYAGSPLNILINGCLIATGEVVVVNEKYGIRVTDIKSPTERVIKNS